MSGHADFTGDPCSAMAVDVEVGVRELGDRLAGAHGLTEKSNVFDEREVLREHAANAKQGARVRDVRGDGGAFAARGDVLATAAGAMTTADLVASERRLISAALGRIDEGTAIVPARALERALAAADRPLTGQQAAAVRGVATSGNGVDVVEARARSTRRPRAARRPIARRSSRVPRRR